MKNSYLLLLALIAFLPVSCNKDDKETGRESVRNYECTTGIDRPFTEGNILCRNIALYKNTAIQGFHLDSDGKTVWWVQMYNQQLAMIKGWRDASEEVTKQNSDVMILNYFGHGTNIAVEESGEDRYLWAGTYGTPDEKGWFWHEKVIGRIRFQSGKTFGPDQCDDYYYIGEYTNMHPSIDAENDFLTVNYQDNSDANKNRRCFVVYRLSEALKAPVRSFPITCSDAFQTGNAKSMNQIPVTVSCHDLTVLEPVARFSFPKTGYGGGDDPKFYDWQGFDFHKDRLYYYEGQSNQSLTGSLYSGESFIYVTVFDKTGRLLEKRTRLALTADKDAMSSLKLSIYGYIEAEGIKVYGNKLYLGGCTRGISSSDWKFYNNIFVFNTSKK